MNKSSLERELSRRGSSPARVASSIMQSPALVKYVVDGLLSDTATIRFNSSKVMLAAAQKAPEAVRPHLRSILALLDSENKTLQSAAIRTLGYLARVDSRGQITRTLDKLLALVPGPDLMVASNAIEGAARIARAKPHVADRVVPALLSVESGRYKSSECRNIAI